MPGIAADCHGQSALFLTERRRSPIGGRLRRLQAPRALREEAPCIRVLCVSSAGPFAVSCLMGGRPATVSRALVYASAHSKRRPRSTNGPVEGSRQLQYAADRAGSLGQEFALTEIGLFPHRLQQLITKRFHHLNHFVVQQIEILS